MNTARNGRTARRADSPFIACSATGPRQWITMYTDGRVRLHAADLSAGKSAPFRTLVYRPKRKSDRDAIRRVVEHLNMMGAGYEGEPCEVRHCFESQNSHCLSSQK